MESTSPKDDSLCSNESENSAAAWLRFVRESRWSRTQKHRLLREIGQPGIIYQHSDTAIRQVLQQVGKTAADQARPRAPDQRTLTADKQWLLQSGHHLVRFTDSAYPESLREIHNPPIAFFASGDLACLQRPAIAIVGSRRPTPVGSQFAKTLARDLATLGLTVVSGLALGIDGDAHRGALAVEGATVAVMAGGIDQVYPSRHRRLYQQVEQQACVISEHPPGITARRHSFPQRNRIVSGLAAGVVIIEAAERSGTLITARLAMEQNREVMVVPGSVLSAQYRGSHQLIQQGAALVRDAQDVLEQLPASQLAGLGSPKIVATREHPQPADNRRKKGGEQPLLAQLSDQPTSIDELILASGLTASEVSSMLLLLELEGEIAVADNGGYVRLS
ncbi:MAG: DNA-processing protein DprA [Pseudomonadota bacterium]